MFCSMKKIAHLINYSFESKTQEKKMAKIQWNIKQKLITSDYSTASSHFAVETYSCLHGFSDRYVDRPTLVIDTNNMSYYCSEATAATVDDCRL